MPRPAGRALGFWLRVGGTLAALATVLWLVPWTLLAENARRLSLAVWIAVLCGFLAGHLLGACKWTYLLRRLAVPIGWRDGGACYGLGLFANLCLPGIVGGDLVRAAAVARRAGRMESVALAGVADRLLDILALGAILAGGLAAAGARAARLDAGWVLGAAVAVALSAAALVALLLRRPQARWPRRMRRPIGRARLAARRLARMPGVLAVTLAAGLAIQSGFVLLNVWIGRDLELGVPLAGWYVAWPLAKLAGLLPVSLGGLGVRDATFGSLLAGFGAPLAAAVVVSFVWQSVLIAGGLLAGAAGWLALGTQSADSAGLLRGGDRG
jgi:glycosyltransferase 2 family protein